MISAYHLVWAAYGWWLPNDPRGSNSRVVRVGEIADLGTLHQGRKQIQPPSAEIRDFYDGARERLKFPLLRFTPDETRTIGDAFADVIRDRGYTCYACAIMSDHVHLVIRKHRDHAETIIEQFQKASAEAVRTKPQARRDADHPVLGGPGWKRFLASRLGIERAIEYVEKNAQVRQNWPFVVQYDGWIAGAATRRAKPQAPRRTSRPSQG
jgi:REP element-mobilizing transposase RayT